MSSLKDYSFSNINFYGDTSKASWFKLLVYKKKKTGALNGLHAHVHSSHLCVKIKLASVQNFQINSLFNLQIA
jgi:hypothetical protein